MLNEKIEKYFEKKKKLFLNKENNLNKSNDNLLYKVLKRREQDQFIRKLDKSRSTLNVIKKIPEIPDIVNNAENKKEPNVVENKIKKNK